MRNMFTQTFEEVKSNDLGNKPCYKCGKNICRTFTASQTINPWNNKTRIQIREENAKKISSNIDSWKKEPEKCSSCIKNETPDIDLNFITRTDWEETENLRNEILTLRKMLTHKEKELEGKFKGRHIEVLYKGKVRLARVECVTGSYYNNDFWFQYDLIRKDMKGITDFSSNIEAHKIF